MSQTSTFGLVGIGLACGALIGATVMGSHAAPQPASSVQGQLTACVSKKSGVMRMVKAGTACKKRERAVTWGITGPVGSPGSAGVLGVSGPTGPTGERGFTGENGATGEKGATGERGAQGVQGERGPSDVYGNFGGAGPSKFVEAAPVAVPAGKYVFHAVIGVAAFDTSNPCFVMGKNVAGPYSVRSDQVRVSWPGWYDLQGWATLDGPGTLLITCGSVLGGNNWQLMDSSLIVTEVKTLHVP